MERILEAGLTMPGRRHLLTYYLKINPLLRLVVPKMKTRLLTPILFLLSLMFAHANDGPIHVLFLGHPAKHHNSNEYYPMLAKALGRDAIYFDYTVSVEEALGEAKYLNKFDVLLLYANHATIQPHQWKNLKSYVENGGGFVPALRKRVFR